MPVLKRNFKTMLKEGDTIRVQLWEDNWLHEEMTGIVVNKRFLNTKYEYEEVLVLQLDRRNNKRRYVRIDLVEFERN